VSDYWLLNHSIDVRLGRTPPQLAFGFCPKCGFVILETGFDDDSQHRLYFSQVKHDVECPVHRRDMEDLLNVRKQQFSTKRFHPRDAFG